MGEVTRPLPQQAGAVGAEGSLRKRRQTACQLAGLFEGITRLGQPLDETDAKRLDSRYRAAGQDQVHRTSLADHARQANAAEVDERDAEAAVEDAPRRLPARHPAGAPQREVEASRDRTALHRGGEPTF